MCDELEDETERAETPIDATNAQTDETHHGIRIHENLENLMNETPVDDIPTGGTLRRATLIDESTENGRANTPGTLETATLESASLESAALESATVETATLESATLEETGVAQVVGGIPGAGAAVSSLSRFCTS